VRGTSHGQSGQPCQDYAFATAVHAGEETILLVTCADGAGSAGHSDIGSKLACENMISRIGAELDSGLSIGEIDQFRFLRWYGEVRSFLEGEATARDMPLREFACTLLTAIVGENCAAFGQIGDGVIIFREENGYQAAMWPPTGEYANITYFLTDEDFNDQMEFCRREGSVDELALLTDGLQTFALVFAEKRVHAPFFVPMFEVLRNTPKPDDLIAPLRVFLDSTPVNERTDDDKTLVLATRRQQHGTQNAV
jgi:hypothetical protein